MNPHYLWLTGAMQLLTFFVIAPILAIGIPYAASLGRPQNFKPEWYGIVGAASGVATLLLFSFAKWINADVRTAQYFLQLACFILSGLLFGVFMGCGFCVFFRVWRWHTTTRLANGNQTDSSKNQKSHPLKLVLYVALGFLVMAAVLSLVTWGRAPANSPALLLAFVSVCAIPTLGAFWMIHTAIRHEKNPFPMVLLALLIPFAFMWFYFERVRPRRLRRNRNLHCA